MNETIESFNYIFNIMPRLVSFFFSRFVCFILNHCNISRLCYIVVYHKKKSFFCIYKKIKIKYKSNKPILRYFIQKLHRISSWKKKLAYYFFSSNAFILCNNMQWKSLSRIKYNKLWYSIFRAIIWINFTSYSRFMY